MIDIVVRGFLGGWGQQILDVYLKYSLWINALILFYFLVLIISQWNYRQTLDSLVQGLQDRYSGQLQKKSSAEISNLLKKKEIPWETGLKASMWPLIATPRNLVPRLKNQETLQKLIPLEVLAQRLNQNSASKSRKSDQAGRPT